ncbi:ATP-dependent nuclease [Aliiroseovarius sp.]|uniref:ATP-dependent nuclease n=1 Tax=Aliiroseovarius sp. TaxID=1872442 RepID=UPI003BA8A19F
MKLSKVEVKNFRLLKDVSIPLEDELSLIIGKNNCGKTSLLLLLERFLGSSTPHFAYEDISLDTSRKLLEWISSDTPDTPPPDNISIELVAYISYDENDDLSNVGRTILMDLNPENKTLVLVFEYGTDEKSLAQLKKDFKAESARRIKAKAAPITAADFASKTHTKYFKTSRKSVLFDVAANKPDYGHFKDLDKEKIKLDRIIQFRSIGARRDVSNKEADKTLSAQSAEEFDRIVASEGEVAAVERFKDSLAQTDKELDGVYDELFNGLLKDISQFGGLRKGDSQIKVVSALRSSKLLKDNTVVKYASGYSDLELPENHNGLGYLNLISMIFDLRGVLQAFAGTPEKSPADINLLFIEEPEAHTHPQLQYIFIKNIKKLLEDASQPDGKSKFSLQTILSTHSPHIVAESEFDEIKYLRRINDVVVAKSLRDLSERYTDEPSWFKFLKQYLTVHRAELFFADKAIFIEGDTERVLLPAMMTKVDQECLVEELSADGPLSLPLNSQNVSIVEVGNYFKTFEKFVQFIGLKSLVITDLDGRNDTGPCRSQDASGTSNGTFEHFFKDKDGQAIEFEALCKLKEDEKAFTYKDSGWANDSNGMLRISFQTKEKNEAGREYQARSFEDAFLHVNLSFLRDTSSEGDGSLKSPSPFPSLTKKHLVKFLKDADAYEMATKGIGSKPSFAIEVLLNSQDSQITIKPHEYHKLPEQTLMQLFVNWNVPHYIRNGLTWLRQD